MTRKFDHEAAFGWYVAQGESRSMTSLAKKFGVSRRAVHKAARKGGWHARLDKIEREAKEQFDRKLTETRAEVRERHLKLARAMQSRGVQALQAHQLDDAMAGIKAIDVGVKMERTILGETTENLGISIQERTRREVEVFLATEDEPEDDDDE